MEMEFEQVVPLHGNDPDYQKTITYERLKSPAGDTTTNSGLRFNGSVKDTCATLPPPAPMNIPDKSLANANFPVSMLATRSVHHPLLCRQHQHLQQKVQP